MATRRTNDNETSGDGRALTSDSGHVAYHLFETTRGVVVQRKVRPGALTRIEHFVRFDRIEGLAACAELEARHLGEPRLSSRLMRAFGPTLRRRQNVDQGGNSAAVTAQYAGSVLNVVQLIQMATNQAEVLELMHVATRAIGADAGCYVSVIPEPGSAPSIRCLFDFDAAAAYERLRQPGSLNDPWLTYAKLHAEPIVIGVDAFAGGCAGALSSAPEFRRAVVFPTPAASGSMRFGAMALGSASEGMFEPEDAGLSCLLGRTLAAEVNGWWLRASAEALRREARLGALDLHLLALKRDGADPVWIADALRATAEEVQRRSEAIAVRLGVSDVPAAIQRAVDHGLV